MALTSAQRTSPEYLLSVLLHSLRGNTNDWGTAECWVVPVLPVYLKPVHFGKLNVHHDKVRFVPNRCLKFTFIVKFGDLVVVYTSVT